MEGHGNETVLKYFDASNGPLFPRVFRCIWKYQNRMLNEYAVLSNVGQWIQSTSSVYFTNRRERNNRRLSLILQL